MSNNSHFSDPYILFFADSSFIFYYESECSDIRQYLATSRRQIISIYSNKFIFNFEFSHFNLNNIGSQESGDILFSAIKLIPHWSSTPQFSTWGNMIFIWLVHQIHWVPDAISPYQYQTIIIHDHSYDHLFKHSAHSPSLVKVGISWGENQSIFFLIF